MSKPVIAEKYRKLVSPDVISSRMHLYKEALEDLEKALPVGMEIVYSGSRLVNLTYSYFYDVERFKDFHQPDKAGKKPLINRNKMLAFTCKWVSKLKPVMLHVDNSEQFNQAELFYYTNLINSLFCIAVVKRILKNKDIDSFVTDSFLYRIHYGLDNESAYMMFFDAVLPAND